MIERYRGRRLALAGLLLLFPIAPLTGCALLSRDYGPYPNLATDDDHKLVEETVMLGRRRERGAIPYLIPNLMHDDQFVRILTHMSLELCVDNTQPVAYKWDWPESSRRSSMKEWEQWYETEGLEKFPPGSYGPAPETPEESPVAPAESG